MDYITPPKKIPIFLKLGIWISEKITGQKMMPARILSWSPKSALGSGVLESLVIHKDSTLSKRLLKLLRLQVSLKVACPFCIDMNGFDFPDYGINKEELEYLKRNNYPITLQSFSTREKIALEYALRLSETPPVIDQAFKEILKSNFSDREIVVLTATISQVNYWARLIQGFGLPPAGFDQNCILT